MTYFRLILATLSALLLLFAACGGDDDDDSGGDNADDATATVEATDGDEPTDEPADATAPPEATEPADDGDGGEVDACSLASSQEVAEIIQKEVEDGEPAQDGFGDACRWVAVDSLGEAHIDVVTEGAAGLYESLALESTPFEGLGDKAFTSEDISGVITVLDGDVLVSVQVINFDLEDETAAAEELARLVLERVP